MSGSPRSSRIRSGCCVRRGDDAFLAGADRLDLVAVRLEAGPQRAADLRLVVDDQHLHACTASSTGSVERPPRCRRPACSSIQMRPPCAVDDRAARSRARGRCPALRLHAPAIERFEHPSRVASAGTPGPWSATRTRTASRSRAMLRPAPSPPPASARARVLEQVRQHLVELHRVDRDLGKVGADVELDAHAEPSRGRIRATTTSTISSIARRPAAGISAPARIRARSRMLPTSRFSRSVSSRIVVSSSRCARARSWSTLGRAGSSPRP